MLYSQDRTHSLFCFSDYLYYHLSLLVKGSISAASQHIILQTMALFFSDNPITLNKDPMVSRISVSFDIEDHLDFSQDQEEKQLPGGASQQALVFFEDGFSSLYKPDEQVYFNNGERITLFGKYGVNQIKCLPSFIS